MDVDIRPLRGDEQYNDVIWNRYTTADGETSQAGSRWCTTATRQPNPDYNQAYTRDLINNIRANSNVEYIFFNDPTVINEGLVRASPGHDNHLDVRFKHFP
jgi:hypothetical protein